MKQVAFYSYFIISYIGTAGALFCLASGRLPIVRFLLYIVCVSGLACLGMKRNGRGGLYTIPGLILAAAGALLFLRGILSFITVSALLNGSLYIVYGVTAAYIGLLTANKF